MERGRIGLWLLLLNLAADVGWFVEGGGKVGGKVGGAFEAQLVG